MSVVNQIKAASRLEQQLTSNVSYNPINLHLHELASLVKKAETETKQILSYEYLRSILKSYVNKIKETGAYNNLQLDKLNGRHCSFYAKTKDNYYIVVKMGLWTNTDKPFIKLNYSKGISKLNQY